jgi:hypothetical protein
LTIFARGGTPLNEQALDPAARRGVSKNRRMAGRRTLASARELNAASDLSTFLPKKRALQTLLSSGLKNANEELLFFFSVFFFFFRFFLVSFLSIIYHVLHLLSIINPHFAV